MVNHTYFLLRIVAYVTLTSWFMFLSCFVVVVSDVLNEELVSHSFFVKMVMVTIAISLLSFIGMFIVKCQTCNERLLLDLGDTGSNQMGKNVIRLVRGKAIICPHCGVTIE